MDIWQWSSIVEPCSIKDFVLISLLYHLNKNNIRPKDRFWVEVQFDPEAASLTFISHPVNLQDIDQSANQIDFYLDIAFPISSLEKFIKTGNKISIQ